MHGSDKELIVMAGTIFFILFIFMLLVLKVNNQDYREVCLKNSNTYVEYKECIQKEEE